MRLAVVLVVLAASVCSPQRTSPTQSCSGRKVLNGDEGFISDGPENYLANSHCEWLIDAGSPNKTIHLEFEKMSTECSFDFLFIYDGNSYRSPLIATLSGDSLPFPVVARSGYMLLYLYSDRNYMKHGFDARYRVFNCPWNCSNHGVCLNHTCRCSPGYHGDGCQHQFCVDNCSGHGTCMPLSRTEKRCVCDQGYIGYACNLSTEDSKGSGGWYTIQPSGSGFRGRTLHTAVFLEGSDCLWVFGGFDLNVVLDDLSKYCFGSNRWEVVFPSQPRPLPRSGHAMAAYRDGFYVYGGVLANDSHSGELWYYNTSSNQWTLRATNSTITPQAVTGHTLTTVDDWLYLVGGKTEDRVFVDDIYRIDAVQAGSWEVVVIKGGRYPPKRLVGHTTIYHKESESLIVYGGYTQGSALFSDRTSQIHSLNLEDNYWSELINTNWPETTTPKQRAFHSAVSLGNYMVVYGGNTHDHAGLEICYNPRMYFYHLGCHVWLNHTFFTGPLSAKGRFGHVAVPARGNLMLVVGGYCGQVLDDLIVYKVPPAVSPHQSDALNASDHCKDYTIKTMCLDDPECVFCQQNHTAAQCVHRSQSDLCIDKQIQENLNRCPGICPALHTCGACVSHGRGARLAYQSPGSRVHIQECAWCVKEAQCQTRSALGGTCRDPNATSTGIEGWWGGLSANLTTLLQCQQEDFPAGLHWVRYRNPKNLTFPDELTIQRTTTGILEYVSTRKIESEFTYTARFVGFLYPLNASPPKGEKLMLYLGLAQAQARLYLSTDDTENTMEKVISIGKQINFSRSSATRKHNGTLFPSVARGYKYYLEQVTEQVQGVSADPEARATHVTVSWNGFLVPNTNVKQHEITSEFLQPYSNGVCAHHYNCLSCLTDTLCSWCQVSCVYQ
ncbi:multiple epidermal growth factor-like domains protein 8 isoform X1 [Pomacea canaliculata]|uniref:multiple epidermal growth factor-like domains protein 8 isoform X1 n=1 Tax=Pomacea canaliculata TaxID=400727 RepID=UPI000D72F860|nr:multiple epidermal growth factor-like domains protein 8 isoform X1 [Pomacea canaliculata]